MNFKVVFGYVTAFSVLGFTGYAIYKHVKNKDVISYEEAKYAIEKHRSSKGYSSAREYEQYMTEYFEENGAQLDKELDERRNSQMDENIEEFEEMKDGIRDQASYNRGFMPYNDDEDVEEIDDTILFTSPIVLPKGDMGVEILEELTEEDRQLKHEPSSQEARQQFINMELADFEVSDNSYQTLLKLFDIPFKPLNDGDYDLKTKLIDYRVQFFGFGSKWVQDISFAEVFLHYARSTVFNYDETIKYWVDYFLQFDVLSHRRSSESLDKAIESLNSHSYYNEHSNTYGLFSLTSHAMDRAIAISHRNVDTALTYDIEYNEFLKSFV